MFHMSSIPVYDDEDGELYINAAARLKSYKSQRHKEKDKSLDDDNNYLSNRYYFFRETDNSLVNSKQSETFQDNSNKLTDLCDVNRNNDSVIRNACPNITNSFETVDLDEYNDSDNDISVDTLDTIRITVRWRSRHIEHIELAMDDPFSEVFKHFANVENVSQTQVLLLKKDVPIKNTDTPSSLGLSITDVLEGGIVNVDAIQTLEFENKNYELDSSSCKIKIQLSGKQSLTYQMKRNERFLQLAQYCADKLNLGLSKMKFYFDGERIQDEDTPQDLDIDDEACIDLQIVS
ncbi:uncharacterized protein CG4449 isoform X1 [Aphidius gifuensis]|uniref:uncharacterized protein CG4449 isoform X1 n=1 Tax=Aphidius gifuensis TaxID=684658 RepID=UPI001CDD1CEE|nr:uncharacterized protein CG4449 isoform X1 [Aphidius gifuensis]